MSRDKCGIIGVN